MALGSVLLPQLAAAAALPEPALRLSPALAPPVAGVTAEERGLLRVEFNAAQTQAAEADVVADILARVRRMDGMVADIRRLVETWPQADAGMAQRSAAGPGAVPASLRHMPPAEDDSATTPDASLTMRALMASVIVFLFWLLGKRHSYIKAQRLRAAAAAAPEAAPSPTAAGEAAGGVRGAAAGGPIAAEVAAPAVAPPVARRQPEPALPDAAAAPNILAPSNFETITSFGKAAPAIMSDNDQSLELAEIMVSMGLAHGAAKALTERIRDNPRRALYHWLKLLDVYRRSDMRDDFDRAARELRQCFNVEPGGWQAGNGGSHSLEDYPHLAVKLTRLWPQPGCADFLAHLLADNRGGTRQGLPQGVAEEILLLEKMLEGGLATA
jgi:hypothetical protein